MRPPPPCTTRPARPSATSNSATSSFAAPVNTAVLYQACVDRVLAARADRHARHQDPRRDSAAAARSRTAEKGTGRARQGTFTAPHDRGGGVASGCIRARTFSGCRARWSASSPPPPPPSRRAAQGDRHLRALTPSRPRTSRARLRALAADGRVLVVSPGRDQNLELPARNLPTVDIIPGRLAQRRGPHQGRPRADRAARARAHAGGVRVTALTAARDHPATCHQREDDRRSRRAASTRSL